VSAIFLEGDARTILRGIPADFFHCVVTSPPYYGLRKYDGGEEIWDGGLNCEHEWEIEAPPRRSRKIGDIVNLNSKEVTNRGNLGIELTPTSFCSKCAAWKGQLGAEPTPELYIQHLVQVMREVRRVLRPDGVFWVNIGDSWAGGKGQSGSRGADFQEGRHERSESLNRGYQTLGGQKETRVLDNRQMLRNSNIKPLDMVLIPSLLALALREDGWYVRSQVVWQKNNPMPESTNGWRWERHKVPQCPNCKSYSSIRNRICRVCGWKKSANRGETEAWRTETGQQEYGEDGGFKSDSFMVDCPGCPKCEENDGYVLRKGSWRPTDSYELILMLTKTNNYYCDKYAVVEPITSSTKKRVKSGLHQRHPSDVVGKQPPIITDVMGQRFGPDGGRNLRSVWNFPTTPGKFNHYAAFPPRLPEICIKASTSEKGCCPKCGAPWARVIEQDHPIGAWGNHSKDDEMGQHQTESRVDAQRLFPNDKKAQQDYVNHVHDHHTGNSTCTVDWRPTCSCDIGDPVSCRVLDPFSGAGTTSLAAERLGVDSIGIDTSAKYINISRDRLADDELKRRQ